MDDLFPLTVTLAADEWAHAQRRIRYLEAALVQAYRAQRQLKEWFSAADLAVLRLPDLPTTRQGIVRHAHAENWLCRTCPGRGGARYEFHFSSLPRKAFEDMIRRIVEPSAASAEEQSSPGPAEQVPVVAPSSPETLPSPGDTTAPPWVLPLLRLIRAHPALQVETALTMLDLTLPEDAPHPTLEEIAAIFRRHGRNV